MYLKYVKVVFFLLIFETFKPWMENTLFDEYKVSEIKINYFFISKEPQKRKCLARL